MKKKILALVFAAVMLLGFVKTADSCETVSQPCPGGGGWTGIVCEPEDWLFFNTYYCTESEIEEDAPEAP